MILYIIRHAWAGHAGDPAWPDDFQRPLTPDGRKRFRRMVEILAGRGFNPELVVTSPLVRCRQTAEVVADAVARQPGVIERDELMPGADLDRLLSWTESEAVSFERIAWVGHAPDVGAIASELLSGSGAWLRFAKGAVAAIDFDRFPEPGRGELHWMVTAKVLGV
ncbi:MAG: histidine phosphatase family protein [Pirellulales bacterium]|nr:histidine phosphatase family protein [Pirellulales bacterium]